MRIFAVSDVHVDFQSNARWIASLSKYDYRDDVLILAGDIADTLKLLVWCLSTLAARFKKVLFVPGNHDLWVLRESNPKISSLEKFDALGAAVESSGASMEAFFDQDLAIVPLLGWYDYSFGEPSDELRSAWMDYQACRWPPGLEAAAIAKHFTALNKKIAMRTGDKVITFSHFLPRIDVMPSSIPSDKRWLYPILGSTLLERQLRRLGSSVHVYGHSHVNRSLMLDGVSYINNAFGYPREAGIAAKQLLCIYATS